MFFAVSSDGQMSRVEMLTELSEARICPVMTYREEGIQVVPIFAEQELAYKFAKRNTPQKYSIGTMAADESDLQSMRDAGFEVRTLTWPNKRDTEVYVLQLTEPVQTHERGYRAGNPDGKTNL